MKRGGMAVLAVGIMALAGGLLPAAAMARTYTIVIDKMTFGPVPARLRVGDTILWVNRDLFRHTATAKDHSFDIDLKPNKSGKLVLKRAGAIAFSCRFHPGMNGVLTVAK